MAASTTTERSSLLLLQQQYNNTNGSAAAAATNSSSTTTTTTTTTIGSSSSELFVSTTIQSIDDATHWFELSCTNFAPNEAPMWWRIGRNYSPRRTKPNDLAITVSLWEALTDDLNVIYIHRFRFVLGLYVIALTIALPVCNLIFPTSRWWIIFFPVAVILTLCLRHELTFTNECLIPLKPLSCNNDDDDDHLVSRNGPPPENSSSQRITMTKYELHPYYAPFSAVVVQYKEELASHGVRASVMADEVGATPQRAYLIFQPLIESGSEGLYFV